MSNSGQARPTDFEGWISRNQTNPKVRVLFPQRDDTEIEAMLRTPPGGPDRGPSLEETSLLREALGRAVESLPPEDRWIVERLLIEGTSLRKTGVVLGIPKTTLARRRDHIKQRLVSILTDDPDMRGWITPPV